MAYPQNVFGASRSASSLRPPLIRPASDSFLFLPKNPAKPAKQPQQPPRPSYTFLCTIYWTEHEPPPHTFGLQSRISPLRPPPYFDDKGFPHNRGMTVDEPPVCSRCSIEPQSLAKLEQHVRRSRSKSAVIHAPAGLLDGAGWTVSLSDPLNPEANKIGIKSHGSRSMPPWMSLLPSVRRQKEHPQPQSQPQEESQRRSKVPYLDTADSSKPCQTRPQDPDSLDQSSKLPSALSPVPSQQSTNAPLVLQLQPPPQGISHKPSQGHQAIAPSNARANLQPSPFQTGLNTLQRRADEPKGARPCSTPPIQRSLSIQRRIDSLSRATITKNTPPASSGGACSWSKSQDPMPSQDIAPAKSPLYKELSGFFATRAAGGKWTQSYTQNTARISTPSRISRMRACDHCGADMSDWWLGRASDVEADRNNNQGQGQGHGDGVGFRTQRVCSGCKARP
ncbi:hypothetical protein A1O1_05969 [Capronia coronata CBS 617.96]|uniref:Uncharacterized protein n=1 Tax=Capronia coronata CBS 617.96 TaxID=1182541 RepID=W9XZE1_9EURO|nr:uncharacterized protein A1O1_05969 [Capronia coronata CBS 617.96]EXJ85603.1 hypothetical protein A1O1_05969 [Capronia coronata CBS 617.96]